MRYRSRITCVLASLLLVTLLLIPVFGDEMLLRNGKQLDKEEAITWLREAARVSRANRERIRTWKGELKLSEQANVSSAFLAVGKGRIEPEKLRQQLAADRERNHRRSGEFDVSFVVDQLAKSLHCDMQQTKPYLIVDLKTKTETKQEEIEFFGMEIISTPTVYVCSHGLPSSDSKTPHHIIKESPSAAKGHSLRSILIDPLQMFVHGGWTFDDLYSKFADGAEREPERCKVFTGMVDGFERREIVATFNSGANAVMVHILVAPELNCVPLRATEGPATQITHSASWEWERSKGICIPRSYVIESRDDKSNDVTFRRKFEFRRSILNEPLDKDEFSLSALEVQEGDLYQDLTKRTQGKYTNGTFEEAPVKPR